jgi:hypothetical protein
MAFVVALRRFSRAFVAVGVAVTGGACSHTPAAVPHSTPSLRTTGASTTSPPASITTAGALQAAKCQGIQLSITGTQGVATGHIIWRVTFRNQSGDPCYVTGYPSVTAVDSAGKVLARAIPTPEGFGGGISGSTQPPVVTLKPRAIGTVIIEALDAPTTSTAKCVTYAGLLVSAPGTSTQERIFGGPSCSTLLVHPVLPGSEFFYP